MMSSRANALSLVAGLAFLVEVRGQTCTPEGWMRHFGEGIVGNSVASHAVYDPDGPGPEGPRMVVLSGYGLNSAGGHEPKEVVAWDGRRWLAMDEGLPVSPFDLGLLCLGVVEDPGTGHQTLYVAGKEGRFLRWDVNRWTQLPAPIPVGFWIETTALCSFDEDGSGPQPACLFASVYSGAVAGANSALERWDGTAWTTTGLTYAGRACDMISVDHPGFAGIYVAAFSSWHSTTISQVKKWDGSTGSVLASWVSQSGPSQVAYALAFLNGEPEPSLYVGGRYSTIAGIPARAIARWNGNTWFPADAGLGTGAIEAFDLTVIDADGVGPGSGQLFAAGYLARDTEQHSIISWDGTSWSTSLPGITNANALGFDDGEGVQSLFALGRFSVAGNNFATNIARKVGPFWLPVGQTLTNSVHAMANQPVAGAGLAQGLYAGGAFFSAGRSIAVGVARWNGQEWSPLGVGVNDRVDALAIADIGGGVSLIAGGKFVEAGGISAPRVARWNGSAWSAMGLGFNERVAALATFKGSLFAGGVFTASGASPTPRVAGWNGSAWVACGPGANGDVLALAEFDDGTGSALYAGGSFTSPGAHVARWNGTAWSPLAAGLNGTVHALAAYNDGSGPALYAAGEFGQSGSTALASVARWNGIRWSPLGAGLNGTGRALKVFEVAGPGPRRSLLAVGGDFTAAGGVPAANAAIWDGLSWSALPGGLDGTVRSLGEFDPDGAGPQAGSLMLGGDFLNAGGASSPRIAEWRGCSVCYSNCDGSSGLPVLSANDFVCFLNKFVAGDPYANCDASTVPPVLTANDFVCFIGAFSAGCN